MSKSNQIKPPTLPLNYDPDTPCNTPQLEDQISFIKVSLDTVKYKLVDKMSNVILDGWIEKIIFAKVI